MFGALLGGAAALGKLLFGAGQNKRANRINPKWQEYITSPYAQQKLGLAQQLFNARMPGATAQERNIYGTQGNTLNAINRNATNSAQALALAGDAQGQTNQAFNQLAIDEAGNKMNMLNNLNQGYSGMIEEGDKVHQNKMQKFIIDTQQQAALRNSAWQNIFGAGNDLAGMFTTLGKNSESNNFWEKLFGGKQNSAQRAVPFRAPLTSSDFSMIGNSMRF